MGILGSLSAAGGHQAVRAAVKHGKLESHPGVIGPRLCAEGDALDRAGGHSPLPSIRGPTERLATDESRPGPGS